MTELEVGKIVKGINFVKDLCDSAEHIELQRRSKIETNMGASITVDPKITSVGLSGIDVIDSKQRVYQACCILLWVYWEDVVGRDDGRLRLLRLIRNCMVHCGADTRRYISSAETPEQKKSGKYLAKTTNKLKWLKGDFIYLESSSVYRLIELVEGELQRAQRAY